MVSPAFLLTALIVVLVPGTGAIYTIAVGLSQGRRASVVAAFGYTLGIVPHLTAALLGLSALMETSAELFQALKWAGAAYLLYLAVQTLREKGALRFEARRAPARPSQIVRTGVLINILNPKLAIFFFAFLPQFAPTGATGLTMHMLVLSAIFMAMTLMVFAGYGIFAAHVREAVLSSERAMGWMRRIAALAFAGMGLKLALSDR